MHPSTILISENPGGWHGALAARDQLRELALRLFISLHAAYLSFTRRHPHESPTPMGAAVQACLNEMKRSIGIACVLLLVMAAIMARVWFRTRRNGNVRKAMKHAEGVEA